MSRLLLVVSISGEDHVHFALTNEYALHYPLNPHLLFLFVVVVVVVCSCWFFVCLFVCFRR